jgi:hypothetical protein
MIILSSQWNPLRIRRREDQRSGSAPQHDGRGSEIQDEAESDRLRERVSTLEAALKLHQEKLGVELEKEQAAGQAQAFKDCGMDRAPQDRGIQKTKKKQVRFGIRHQCEPLGLRSVSRAQNIQHHKR